MTTSDRQLIENLNKKMGDIAKGEEETIRSYPVQTLYGGADRFSENTPQKMGNIALKMLDTYAPNFIEFALAIGIPLPYDGESLRKNGPMFEKKYREEPETLRELHPELWLAGEVYTRVREKLQNQPVEDFRIDFEDGFGYRTDEEEDSHARRAAESLAAALEKGTAPPWIGIRIKALTPPTSQRAARTLRLFLSTLLENPPHRLPENFTVTLPKVHHPLQTETLSKLLDRLEGELNLPNGSIKIDILLESPELIAPPQPENNLAQIVRAGGGRIWAASFGTYDFTSQCGVASSFQSHTHPLADFARSYFKVALAPLKIEFVDSVTTAIPTGPHKPSPQSQLSPKQWEENFQAISKAWRVHFRNVQHSLKFGIYWGWDLHPGQLPVRYAALYHFFLSNYAATAERMKNFILKQTRATLSGTTFDDAASAAGLINFFHRAHLCGALSKTELQKAGIQNPRLLSSPLQFIQSLNSHEK